MDQGLPFRKWANQVKRCYRMRVRKKERAYLLFANISRVVFIYSFNLDKSAIQVELIVYNTSV